MKLTGHACARRRGCAAMTAAIAAMATAMTAAGLRAQDRPAAPKGAVRTPPAAAGRAAAPSPVAVRASVSKTAVWVGDRVTYQIAFRFAPDVELLADDIASERVRLDGLEMLSTEVERDTSVPGQITQRVRYHLATYAIGVPSVSIGAMPVRYYLRRPGQRLEDAVPSGEVQVPAMVLPVRSTLPDTTAPLAIRDERGAGQLALPLRLRLARPIGLGLVLMSVLPVAWWGLDLVRRARRSASRHRGRQTKKQRRALFDEIKALDVGSETARRDAYDRLDAWIRANVQHATGVTAAALTPSEITGAVPSPRHALPADQLEELLLECERAKYAPEAPPPDRWSVVLDQAEQLLGAR